MGSAKPISVELHFFSLTLLMLDQLQELEGYYEKLSSHDLGRDFFSDACETAFSGVDLSHIENTPREKVMQSLKGTATVERQSEIPTISGNTSLRASMGSWKPSPHKGVSSNQPPPLTVTGVAPWAFGGPKQPPFAVARVAPRAIKKGSSNMPSSVPFRKPSSMIPRQTKLSGASSTDDSHITEVTDMSEAHQLNDEHVHLKTTALDEVRAYMKKLKPNGESEEGTDGVSSWAKAQMAESPVLFPNLKFHDLVFGQELGLSLIHI